MSHTATLPHRNQTDPSLERAHRIRKIRKKAVPWLFILPILTVHLIVIIGPSLSAFYYSLTDWSGVGKAVFIGLDNFHRLFFIDTAFKKAFLNNLTWLAIFLTVPFILSLGAASLLAPVKRGGMFFRITLFIPYVLPGVVVAQTWRYLLNPLHGVGAWLTDLGIKGLDIAFLGSPKTVMPTVAFVDNWHWWGFLMVLFLAAMQNIPQELYEAARIDGANRWQEFWHITLPGIRPTLTFMILMSAIWSFLVFDYIWILTQGGPAGASEVLGTLVVKNAFFRFEAGYAAAIGLTMSALAGMMISVFVVLRRKGWEI
jgi:raffinose/stachyose/melibiose transport system permease protein